MQFIIFVNVLYVDKKKLDNYEQTTHPEVSLELSFLARAM